MTMTPSKFTVVRNARIASTAAPSAFSFCPRPMNGTERIAAASVARTSSIARLRSGCRGSCPRSGSP
jgi:sulfite reductase beta subunit-like hemoprotein